MDPNEVPPLIHAPVPHLLRPPLVHHDIYGPQSLHGPPHILVSTSEKQNAVDHGSSTSSSSGEMSVTNGYQRRRLPEHSHDSMTRHVITRAGGNNEGRNVPPCRSLIIGVFLINSIVLITNYNTFLKTQQRSEEGFPPRHVEQLFSMWQGEKPSLSHRSPVFDTVRRGKPSSLYQTFISTWPGGYPLLVASDTRFDVARRVSSRRSPIFNMAKRVSSPPCPVGHPFQCSQERDTLLVTSKQNPPNLGHGYGFGPGDLHLTRTRTRTH